MATYPPRFLLALLAAALSLAFAAPARADESVLRKGRAEATLLAEVAAVVPGAAFDVGVRFRTDPGWHVYWRNPGESGTPPAVEWRLPPDFSAGPLRFPAPNVKFRQPGVTTIGFEGEPVLLCRIEVPSRIEGAEVEIAAEAEWLVCDKEGCEPGGGRVSLRLPVRTEPSPADPALRAAFDAARAALPRPLPAGSGRAWLEGKTLAVEVPAFGTKAGAVVADVFPDPSEPFDLGPLPTAVRGMVEGTERLVVRIPLAPKGKAAPERFTGVVTERAAEGTAAWELDVAVLPTAPPGVLPPPALPAPAAGDTTLFLALLLAFVGGLLLNLMPCVLPVLSVKILGFVQQAGEDPLRVRRHGYAFGVGVVASFWALAGLLLVLRAGGEGLGWGFQLQEPAVVGALALLLFAVGLNLLGVFEIGTTLSSWAGAVAGRSRAGYGASFWNGVFATVVATPCTAPFMGAAVGYAVSHSAVESLAVFTSLGGGMAAPYVALSVFPRWLEKVPKPGPWMVTFKQVMAFPVFGTVVWLGWVFSRETSADGLVYLWIAMLAISLAGWFHGRFAGPERVAAVRWSVGRGLAAVALLAGVVAVACGVREIGPPRPPPPGWEPWSEERVAQELAAGKPVFVDFTADWCATCKANDVAFLSTDTVHDAVRKHGVVLLLADWTRKDPKIERALASFGRSSVPLYVVYSPVPGRKPEVLPTAITSGLVADAIVRAAQPAGPSE